MGVTSWGSAPAAVASRRAKVKLTFSEPWRTKISGSGVGTEGKRDLEFARELPHAGSMADDNAVERCSRCLEDPKTEEWIHCECVPVPFFGSPNSGKVRIATVGINPSSNEFYAYGKLKPQAQRLAALADYGVSREQLTEGNVADAKVRRERYFSGSREPNKWFVNLGKILSSVNEKLSYASETAVHLDIAACVTNDKWSSVNIAAQTKIVGNCRSHLERTVASLPGETILFCDGTRVCETLRGKQVLDWRNLPVDGENKTVEVVQGTFPIAGRLRRFAGWNRPANYLPESALGAISKWILRIYPELGG